MTVALVTQSRAHALKARADDCYETPESVTRALMEADTLPETIWEPACGPGAMARVLRAGGHRVIATDLVDYGSPDQDEARRDFLMEPAPPEDCDCIVMNPPFKLANAFVEHALDLVPEVHCVLRLAWLEGTRRSHLIDGAGLRTVRPFRNRIPAMHRYGWTGSKATSAIAFAWFSWVRGYDGPPMIERITAVTQ